jgi:hypothetical protein
MGKAHWSDQPYATTVFGINAQVRRRHGGVWHAARCGCPVSIRSMITVPAVRVAACSPPTGSDCVRLRPTTPRTCSACTGDPELHLITDDEPFLPRHVGQVQARPEKQLTEPPDGQTMVSLLAETVADGTFWAVQPVRPPRRLAAPRGARPRVRDRSDPAALPVRLPQP